MERHEDTRSLQDECKSNAEVSLVSLFSGRFTEATSTGITTLESISFQICDIEGNARKDLERLARYGISKASGVARSYELTVKILRILAEFIGKPMNYEAILGKLRSEYGHICSLNTLKAYIADLRKMHVLENSPAWKPELNSRTDIRTKDTVYFIDSSIAAAALSLDSERLVEKIHIMASLFENMAIRNLRIYAAESEGAVMHYRDRNGLECDAVVVLPSGRFGLVEIKLGGLKLIKDGIATLTKLEGLLREKPTFKMVLTAVGDEAFRVENDILIVPFGMLGP